MSSRCKQDSQRSVTEAASWVARLQSGDATPEDRAAFEAWRTSDPANDAAYNDLAGLWTQLKEVPIPAGRLHKLRRTRRAAIGGALGLGLLAMLSLWSYGPGTLDRLRADHHTAVGEVRYVVLEDGTRVDLNTDTAIEVRYTPSERRIVLLRGEAFFAVARQPDRPFRVEDGRLTATALGTRYGVVSEDGGGAYRVQVEEGRVEVTGPADRAVLGAGDTATFTDGRLVLARTDIDRSTAWREGRLVFSGQPLGEVLETLQRYRGGRILVLDAAASGQKVSGIFDLADTDQALRALEDSLPVSVTRLSGLLTIVRSR